MNARYYVPGVGRFASADSLVPAPANPQSLNRYSYVNNNPLNATDPSGHAVETVWDAANIIMGVGSLGYNLWNGNWGDAAWDAGGLVLDVGATAIPFLPGGAATAIKVGRSADNVVDAVNALDNVTDAVRAVDDIVDSADATRKTVSSYEIYWSQKRISPFTSDGLMLDDLSQSMAQGWKGDPLRVYRDATGRLVSLDNRRLTAAKILGIDVPIELVDPNSTEILRIIKKRDGAFDHIPITIRKNNIEDVLEVIGMQGEVLK